MMGERDRKGTLMDETLDIYLHANGLRTGRFIYIPMFLKRQI